MLSGKKGQGPGAVHGKATTKGSSSVNVNVANTATSAGNRERKRKSDLTKQDSESVHYEHHNPPAKRGKVLPDAEQRTRPVQRLGLVMEDPMIRPNTKKRPSEAADRDHENDPKTPVPSKKARIELKEKKSIEGVPLRRTGKVTFVSTPMKLTKKNNRNNDIVRWIGGGSSKTYRVRPGYRRRCP